MDLKIQALEEYAKKNHIPIMMKDGIEYMLTYIQKHPIKNILEIGSAIGYSAIRMALIDKNIHVTTVERDKERYEVALKNIASFHLEKQITIYCMDAYDLTLEEEYDLVFIDAAKSQYIGFFEKFDKNVKKGGVIFSDNLNFHGLTHTNEPIESRNVRGIVRKLNNYILFLKENKEYDTSFLDIGDGISISIKK
jgi:predicted O-methyltransferase YrrM